MIDDPQELARYAKERASYVLSKSGINCRIDLMIEVHGLLIRVVTAYRRQQYLVQWTEIESATVDPITLMIDTLVAKMLRAYGVEP